MEYSQRKVTSNGVQSWIIALETVHQMITWAGKDPDRLQQEISEMQQPVFNQFILTVAASNGSDVQQCRHCLDLPVFWGRELRCVNCALPARLDNDLDLAYIGRLPSLIGRQEGGTLRGRPFLKRIFRKVQAMESGQQALYQSYFLTISESIYFSPPVICVFPNNWPRQPPRIYFRNEYFKILDIPATHLLGRGSGTALLCNYASWKRVTLARTLQQRIIPRIIIDLMFADLQAVGKFKEAMRGLGGSMYDAYNFIGRRHSARFQEVYERYVTID